MILLAADLSRDFHGGRRDFFGFQLPLWVLLVRLLPSQNTGFLGGPRLHNNLGLNCQDLDYDQPQGRFWILHLQKACCGRRCKLWSIDGRGGTVSGEVKSLFIISACAASIVSICIKMCRIFIQLSFVFLQYKIPWSISKAEVWVHTTKSKNFCLSYCKFGQQWQHKLRS